MKKTLTIKQRRHYQNLSDRMSTAHKDMTEHIIAQVESGYYTAQEVLADPTVYFDSAILGYLINNYVIRQTIIRNLEKHFAHDYDSEADALWAKYYAEAI